MSLLVQRFTIVKLSRSAAVTESLESNGTLLQLRAKVRAGIYEALENPQVHQLAMHHAT